MPAHTKVLRFLALVLIFPCALREWIDTLTDTGSYQGNVALIHKILSYHPTAVQTIFDRTIDNMWICYVGAVGFVVWHLTLALLLTIGMVQIYRYHVSATPLFKQKSMIAIVGLVIAISSYLLFFGVLAMDYFMSQLQGFNYNLPIIATLLPCGIALIYLLLIE